MPGLIQEICKPFDEPVVSDKLKWNLKPYDFIFYICTTSVLKKCWEYAGLAVFSAFVNNKMNIKFFFNANNISIYFIFGSYLKFIKIFFRGVILVTKQTK